MGGAQAGVGEAEREGGQEPEPWSLTKRGFRPNWEWGGHKVERATWVWEAAG